MIFVSRRRRRLYHRVPFRGLSLDNDLYLGKTTGTVSSAMVGSSGRT